MSQRASRAKAKRGSGAGDDIASGDTAAAAAVKVLVIGAGAAGSAAAWSLSRSGGGDNGDVCARAPLRVHVWESAPQAGGVATSIDDHPSYPWFNDGVQGGAPTYRNSILFHRRFGFEPRPLHLAINFGKGATWWNNYGVELETELVRRLRPEIRRFGRLIRHVDRFAAVYALVPISKLLRWRGYSDDFTNLMVLPLTALFLGTGNQTAQVPAAVVARVFLDDEMRLFEYDEQRLLSSQPEMFSFDNLGAIYAAVMRESDLAAVCMRRSAASVVPERSRVRVTDSAGVEEVFDQVILACDAESALQLLDGGAADGARGHQRDEHASRRDGSAPSAPHRSSKRAAAQPSRRCATRAQRQALGNVRYYRDITVTHTDHAYMHRHYEMDLRNRNDMYFVRTDAADPSRIDMSFLLSSYQQQLRDEHGAKLPLYQTIFLNERERDRWNIDEIADDTIVLRKWWKQFSHEWRHFAFAVPFMRFAQGGRHGNVWFAGSWTLMNLHEVAVASGLAAAEMCAVACGAIGGGRGGRGVFPFDGDAGARRFYDMYLRVVYGVNAKRHARRVGRQWQ